MTPVQPACMELLAGRAGDLGISLSSEQRARFDRFRDLLLSGNQRVNLTRITAPADIELKHFLDSLTAALPLLERLRAGAPLRLVDVGAGAGLPGLPVKIAFPWISLGLVEATQKKAAFLQHVVDDLRLENVQVIALRAEDAGRAPEHRDHYDWAVARALGPLPVVIELCAPFLAAGGLLVTQRRGDLREEVIAAAPAFEALALHPRDPVEIAVPELADGRGLIVAEKVGPTPARYPRRPGTPAKRPL